MASESGLFVSCFEQLAKKRKRAKQKRAAQQKEISESPAYSHTIRQQKDSSGTGKMLVYFTCKLEICKKNNSMLLKGLTSGHFIHRRLQGNHEQQRFTVTMRSGVLTSISSRRRDWTRAADIFTIKISVMNGTHWL